MTHQFKSGDEVYVNTLFGWEEGTIIGIDGEGYQVRHIVSGIGEAEGYIDADSIVSRDESIH